VKLERERIVEIEHRATRFKSILGDDFVRKAISDGKTADQFSVEAFAALSAKGQQTTGGEDRPIRSELSITRDGGETRLAAMQNAMLLRHDPKFFLAKHPKTGELLNGCGAENQRRAEEMGREYVGLSLMEMARESLEIRGINHRGMNKNRIAELALQAPSRSGFDCGTALKRASARHTNTLELQIIVAIMVFAITRTAKRWFRWSAPRMPGPSVRGGAAPAGWLCQLFGNHLFVERHVAGS
jgi:hypothetical protein